MNDNNQWKLKLASLKLAGPKLASIFSLQLVSISIFLILCILINIFLYHKYTAEEKKLQLLLLNLYVEKVEEFILQDFQNALNPRYKVKDFFAIKNFAYKSQDESKWHYKTDHKVIYISNNIMHVTKGDKYLIVELSNIKKILDDFSKNLFFYTISINDEQVLTNTVSRLVSPISINLPITENILLNICIQLNNQSKPVTLINASMQDTIFHTLCISISIFFVGVVIIFLFIKQRKELMLEKNHKNDILLFLDKDKKFILKCYEYSKKSKSITQNGVEENSHNDYLPLSIIHDIHKNKQIEINIDKIVQAIKDYFHSYKASYQLDNITVDLIHGDVKFITLPFDYEVFYQIVISIIYNLMSFNKKSKDKRKIIIDIRKMQIIISSDGLKLNKEYAIKASEMIFQDTANPYLMNFGQIFVLFNKNNIKFDVCCKKNGTVITIILPSTERSGYNSFDRVVNLNKYREGKIQ